MSTSSIVEVRDENDALRKRLQRVRSTQAERGARAQSLAVKGVTAYAMKGFGLEDALSFQGFDGATVMAIVGTVGAEFTDGELSKVLADVGETALIVKAYQLGQEHAGAGGEGA